MNLKNSKIMFVLLIVQIEFWMILASIMSAVCSILGGGLDALL